MGLKKLFLMITVLCTTFGFSQTVELDGQRGYGDRKAWDDKNYSTCADWEKAVKNGTYDAPRGFSDIKCTAKTSSGGGVVLTGDVVVMQDARRTQANRTDRKTYQKVSIRHGRHYAVIPQFNTCAQLDQALNNGSYSFPGSWGEVECTDGNGTTPVNVTYTPIGVKENPNRVKAKNPSRAFKKRN